MVGAGVRTLDPGRPGAGAIRAGAIVADGDDAEIRESFDENTEIIEARGAAGVPGERDAEPLTPDQQLSGPEALEGYATGAALAVGEEEGTGGVIKPGFRADVTASALDPVECDADELPELPVMLTVVGRRIVFGDAGFV